VALVLPGAVPELSDPALGGAVRGAAVHESVHHQDADHGVGVPVHRLETLPTLDVPGSNRGVGPSSEENASGAVRGHGGDGARVPSELLQHPT